MAAQGSFSRRSFLAVLAGTASASVLAACSGGGASSPAPAGGQQPATSSTTTTSGAAATPAAAAQPASTTPVLVWQVLDYIPQTTQGVHDRFDAVSKEKGIAMQFEELPNNSSSDDRFNAAVQAGTPPDIWRLFDYQNQWWAVPYAVNCWPFHTRQDILDQNKLQWPKSWDEMLTQAKQITKPPF